MIFDQNAHDYQDGLRSHGSERLLAITIPLLLLAGASGYHYVEESGRLIALLAYAVLLLLSVIALSRKISINRLGLIDAISAPSVTASDQMISEGVRQENRSLRKGGAKSGAVTESCNVEQGSLDFDGIEDLRKLERISGGWLVSEASDRVSALIRQACVEHHAGNEAELSRIQRWLDISDCLRSIECRAQPKAEARRAYVAELCGVSNEQVRQIDQGRYAPLNKLLHQLDPSALADDH